MTEVTINGRTFTGWRADLILVGILALFCAPAVIIGIIIGMMLQ